MLQLSNPLNSTFFFHFHLIVFVDMGNVQIHLFKILMGINIWIIYICFECYIISVIIESQFDHCLALSLLLNFAPIVRFVKVVTWICQSCHMDLSKFLYGFLWVVTWICLMCQSLDLSKLFDVFLTLCQTKPCWSFTKISKFVEASALN